MPKLALPYGSGQLAAETGHGFTTYVPSIPTALPIESEIISAALDNPIASAPVQDIVRPGQKILMVASDITRPVPYKTVLPPLLERLSSSGVNHSDLTVVFANGTHRLMDCDDATAILGRELAQTLHWVNHDARDRGNLVFIGVTGRGTPVWVNRLAAEADHILLTGAVVPHYFAGYGGGRKCLVPGLAGLETTLANHRLVLDLNRGGIDSNCAPGRLDGNPVHDDLAEACSLLPPSFLINVVLDPNHRILYATAGDWRESHLAACSLADEVYGVKLETPYDLVIASCGGFPKDINMIQAHKSLDNAFRFTAPGKVLILLAECSQKIGSSDYLGWFRYGSIEKMTTALSAGYDIHGHTALATAAKARSSQVILVSSLPPETVRQMGLIHAHSLPEALDTAYRLLEDEAPRTCVLPCASLTSPKL